jgi:hypothetical protein
MVPFPAAIVLLGTSCVPGDLPPDVVIVYGHRDGGVDRPAPPADRMPSTDGGTDAEAGTPPPFCALWTTPEEVETKIFKTDCTLSGCHSPGAGADKGGPLDLLSDGVGARILAANARNTCNGSPLINKSAPENSVFMRILPTPATCPQGGIVSIGMGTWVGNDAAKLDCIRAYVRALAARP